MRDRGGNAGRRVRAARAESLGVVGRAGPSRGAGAAVAAEPLEARRLLAVSPIISEFMASNATSLADADDDHSDWVELRNPDTAPVSLAGWYLSDDPADKTKWPIPNVTLPAGGHLVVFASSKDRRNPAAELHTNFNLAAEGESILLVRPDGVTVASQYLNFPAQRVDVSYGTGAQAGDVSNLIAAPAPAKALIPANGNLGLTWTAPTFNDAGWTAGPTAVGYGNPAPPLVPAGYWRLDGTDADASGNNRTGTRRGGAAYDADVPPTIGGLRSLRLDGVDDSFLTPDMTAAFGGDDTVTLSVWFKPRAGGQGGVVVDEVGDGGPSPGWHDSQVEVSAAGVVSVRVWSLGTVNLGTASFGQWHHAVLRYNGDTNTLDGFLDGVEAAADVFGDRSAPFENGNRQFWGLGTADSTSLGNGRAFDGLVDEFVVWDVALNNSQIATVAAGGPPMSLRQEPSPVVAYGTLAGAAGTQEFGGSLGMDFAVNEPVYVTRLGVFDSGADGLGRTLTAQVWSRSGNAGTKLAEVTFTPGAPGALIGSNRFKPLASPLQLPVGQYSVVAYGYGPGERNGNESTGGPGASFKVMNSGDGRVSFVGNSRYSETAGAFPTSPDLFVNAYSAGTFEFTPSFTGLIGTDVGQQMRNTNASAYVRVPFQVTGDPARFSTLSLRMQYDDGFVAYLNGTEVARRRAPATVTWNSAATASQAAHTDETIDVSAFRAALRSGANVLAVHGLNGSVSSTDFLVLPELSASTPPVARPAGYFLNPTPGTLNGPTSASSIVEDTRFSVDRGFFTEPFNLQITTATPGAQIRYTLNGEPPTATTGLAYTGPVLISRTSTVRAAAFRYDSLPTNIDTQTYLFTADIVEQSAQGQPPPGWPSNWGANWVDYGMDQRVVDDPAYSADIQGDLKSLPTYAISMDLDDLFDPGAGIYANPTGDGRGWERPASVELINPDGSRGFQIDAGIRIRGGFSRDPSNPKHAFRLLFRNEYGAGQLNYPVFGPDAAQSFDGFDLRTFQNYSWSFGGDGRFTALRDQFSRDAQLAMGQPAERGNYAHLYINGVYWGLYNPVERPEANYGASYFGGAPDDYDVIKVDPDLGYRLEATDGNMDAWTDLFNQAMAGLGSEAAYQRIQGNNPDGTRNAAYPVLVDADNLIDYMLAIIYAGNFDAPNSAFLGENGPNNFYAVRNRNGSEGFRFFVHDAEHTLLGEHDDRSGPYNYDAVYDRYTPRALIQAMQANPNFKLRVADRIHRHFFNGGALTTQSATERFVRRRDEIFRAVAAESARWGDSKRPSAPLTRDNEWQAEISRLQNTYLPVRSGIVFEQLKADGLYPSAPAAPVFNRHGGTVAAGFQLTMTNPAGAVGNIYYTLNGSDPRRPDGSVTPGAVQYTGPVTIAQSRTVKARVRIGTTWSPLTEAVFSVDTNALRVTELMYHPADPPPGGPYTDTDFEFVEVQNTGTRPVGLDGVRLAGGITYAFPAGMTLGAGQYVLVVENQAAFASRYGTGLPVAAGQYTDELSNGGEMLRLEGPAGETIQTFTYDDGWHPSTDGGGFSLVKLDPAAAPLASWGQAAGWRVSAAAGGSPGRAEGALTTATVADRHLFYNNSRYDNPANGIAFNDDNAIAPNKDALRPGQLATAAHYSSYSRGINGVMVDLAGLQGRTPVAGDFQVRAGNNTNSPTTWATAPTPAVSIRRGAGVGGSDRVTLTWPDGTIKNTWLQVTVRATGTTGLAAADVFYFGNTIGETFNSAGSFRVDSQDVTRTRNAQSKPTNLLGLYDHNRDGRVNTSDQSIARKNQGFGLVRITAPAVVGPPAPAAAGATGAAASTSAAPTGSAGEAEPQPTSGSKRSAVRPSLWQFVNGS